VCLFSVLTILLFCGLFLRRAFCQKAKRRRLWPPVPATHHSPISLPPLPLPHPGPVGVLCSMVSRYAAPMCYNFLRLIHLNHYDVKVTLPHSPSHSLCPVCARQIWPKFAPKFALNLLHFAPKSQISKLTNCYNFLCLIHLNHYDVKSRSLIPLHTVFEKVCSANSPQIFKFQVNHFLLSYLAQKSV